MVKPLQINEIDYRQRKTQPRKKKTKSPDDSNIHTLNFNFKEGKQNIQKVTTPNLQKKEIVKRGNILRNGSQMGTSFGKRMDNGEKNKFQREGEVWRQNERHFGRSREANDYCDNCASCQGI